MRAPPASVWAISALRSSAENTAASSGMRRPRTSQNYLTIRDPRTEVSHGGLPENRKIVLFERRRGARFSILKNPAQQKSDHFLASCEVSSGRTYVLRM